MACAVNSGRVGEALFEPQTLHRAYEYHIETGFSRSPAAPPSPAVRQPPSRTDLWARLNRLEDNPGPFPQKKW